MTPAELDAIEAEMRDEAESAHFYAANALGRSGLKLVAEVRRLRGVLEVVAGRDGFATAQDAREIAEVALRTPKP